MVKPEKKIEVVEEEVAVPAVVVPKQVVSVLEEEVLAARTRFVGRGSELRGPRYRQDDG